MVLTQLLILKAALMFEKHVSVEVFFNVFLFFFRCSEWEITGRKKMQTSEVFNGNKLNINPNPQSTFTYIQYINI